MPNEPRYRIGVDMDDVICDTHNAILEWAEKEFGRTLVGNPQEPIENLLDATQLRIVTDMLNEGSFFRDLRPMDQAPEVLAELYRLHDVFIVTAAMEHPGSFAPKFAWIGEYLPFLDPLRIVFCGEKRIANVDFLIDDSPHHFIHLNGKGILYDAPKNRDERGYPRVRNWIEIAGMFLPE